MDSILIVALGVNGLVFLASYAWMLGRCLTPKTEADKPGVWTILIDPLFYLRCLKQAARGDVQMIIAISLFALSSATFFVLKARFTPSP